MASKIGSLFADLGMRTVAFDKGINRANKQMAAFQKKTAAISKKMATLGAGFSAAVTLPILAGASKSLDAYAAQEKAIAQTEAALKSMGNASGKTLNQLTDDASRLQEGSLFGDEEILTKVTSNLLTFGKVAGEQFDRAQQSALDMSAALGQDLQSSTVMLGKALNDPIAGITAMSRVGVSFTEQQKAQIKAMAEAGDVAGAQTLILAELEKQYGGQAKALAELDSSQATRMWNSIGDAMESVGAVIAPIVAKIADKIKSLAEAFKGLSPQTQKYIVIGSALAAAIGPLLIVLGAMAGAIGVLAPLFVALVSPVGLVVAAVAALAYGAFKLYQQWDVLVDKFPLLGVAADLVSGSVSRLTNLFSSAASWALKVAGDFGISSESIGDGFALIADLAAMHFNFVIGAALSAKDTVLGGFKTMIGSIGVAISTVANAVVSGIEIMINGVLRRLNNVIEFANQLPGIDFGTASEVNLGGVNIGSETLTEGLELLSQASETLTKDYIGQAIAAKRLDTVSSQLSGSLDGAGVSLEAINSSIGETTSVTQGATEALTDLGSGAGEAAKAAGGAGTKIGKAVAETAGEEIKDGLAQAFDNAWDSALDSLLDGDISGAFKGFFSDMASFAKDQFKDLFKDALSSEGGGVGALFDGIKSSFNSLKNAGSSIMAGFSGLFSGGGLSGFGGIGSALSGAMPIIGGLTSLFSVAKGVFSGFSSKKLIGTGLNLGIGEDGVLGGKTEKIKKSRFWGLSTSTSTVQTDFDQETLDAFNAQVDGIRDGVQDVFGRLGRDIGDDALKSVGLAVQKIDTSDMSEAEIDAAIAEIFTEFGDKISNNFGNIDFASALNLANVNDLLDPLGKAFSTLGDTLALSADYADALVEIAGGLDALGAKTASFYDKFFTEDEKLANLNGNIAGIFGDLNLQIPKTKEAFKELVLSQDLTTEKGRENYNALLNIADAFDVVSTSASGAADAAQALADEAADAAQALADEAADAAQALADEIGSIMTGALDVNYGAFSTSQKAEEYAALNRQMELEEVGTTNDLLAQILSELGNQSQTTKNLARRNQ